MGAGASAAADAGVENAAVREVLSKQIEESLPAGSPLSEQYRAAFHRFDANNDGFITADEFLAAASALGQAWSQAECDAVLGKLDMDHDGKISFEDFVAFMESTDAPEPPPVDEARLRQVFLEFASFGSAEVVRQMDNSKFAKLSRDCCLLDRSLTKTDIDLIFTKSKIKGARKLEFQQFKETAIPLMAAKRFPAEEPPFATAMLANLINANGPQSSGTQADSDGTLARMTDESKYTGSHAHRRSSTGASSSTAKRRSSIAKMAGATQDEAAAQAAAAAVAAPLSVQGAGAAAAPTANAAGGGDADVLPPGERPDPLAQTDDGQGAVDEEALRSVFYSFASFGSQTVVRDLDGKGFAKLSRDAKLLDGNLTRTDVDLIFASAKPKNARKMSFGAFKDRALPGLAKKRFPQLAPDEATAALAAVIVESAPATAGTTGVANDATLARLAVDGGGAGSAAERRRNSIERRASQGGNDDGTAAIADAAAAAAASAEQGSRPRSLSRSSRRSSAANSAASLPPAAPDLESGEMPVSREQLNNLFLRFASFGSSTVVYEIDSSKFTKLCKDSGLLTKKLTRTDVDLIFTKSKEKGERKLTYDQFEQVALPLLAQKRHPGDEPFEAIKKVLTKLAEAAPQSSGTQADSDGTLARMTDESKYTGSHAHRRASVGGRRSSAAAGAAAAAAAAS